MEQEVIYMAASYYFFYEICDTSAFGILLGENLYVDLRHGNGLKKGY